MYKNKHYNPLKIKCFLFTILFAQWSFAIKKNESWYQQIWCESLGGQTEYQLEDKTRVDCFTSEHAIEMDFAHKWHEAVGQALHYARKTGKKPGIVLVLQSRSQQHHLTQLKRVIDHFQLPIRVWQLGPWK